MPSAPIVRPRSSISALEAVSSFTNFLCLGVKHILTGYDHLLFLFGLLLVARGFFSSLGIITSFTIAHSITLAVATLHLVQIPSRIVEPLIAASIVFVGAENLLRGDIPQARRVVPFGFGLIHGFGFASALREAGVGRIQVLCLVAAPAGIEAVLQCHSNVSIITASVDQGLNEKSYIVPGLGDAGDRMFGTL